MKWGKQDQHLHLKNLWLQNLKKKVLQWVERGLPTCSHSLVAWNVLIHWGWGKVHFDAYLTWLLHCFPLCYVSLWLYCWCYFHVSSVLWGINPWHLLVLAFGRIIDNKTLRLITESSHSSPKTDKDIQDGNLRGNYLFVRCYFIKVNLYSSLFLWQDLIMRKEIPRKCSYYQVNNVARCCMCDCVALSLSLSLLFLV